MLECSAIIFQPVTQCCRVFCSFPLSLVKSLGFVVWSQRSPECMCAVYPEVISHVAVPLSVDSAAVILMRLG